MLISSSEYKQLQADAKVGNRFKEEKRIKIKELRKSLGRKNENIEALNIKITSRDESIRSLLEFKSAHEKTLKKQIELDSRQATIEANEQSVKDREKDFETAGKKIAEIEKRNYESGYQDGVADGLRKVHEITAEDRRMVMQVAALSAASHSDGATQEIAKEIVKGFNRALPSGKSKS